MKWLIELSFDEEFHAVQRDMHLERIAHLKSLIRRVERILEQEASCHPGVRLLMTIPGVGIRTAEAVIAHMDHPERFARNKAIGSYFGLVPSQDSSAEVNRLGHITRQGPAVVRHMLVEAVWQGIRRSSQIRSHYERIRRGDPKRRKIAVVATAHYLLRVMLSMLQAGQEWSEENAA
jgi:transposase